LKDSKIKNTASRIPNLICPGAQKAGTTTLFLLLSQHPQICRSIGKEIKFFNNYYHKGIDWYSTDSEETLKAKFIMDFTPGYMTEELWVQRMKDTLDDDARLIIILRNPVDRMYSTYNMYLNIGLELNTNAGKAFDRDYREYKAGKTTTNYYRHTLYSEQIKYIFDRFHRDKVKIILFEEMVADPKSTVCDILDFLGLEHIEGMNFDIWKNKAGEKIPSGLFRIVRKLLDFIPKKLRNRLPDGLLRSMRKFFSKRNTTNKRTISYHKDPEVCRILMERLSDDIADLEKILGKDLSSWKEKYK